jgi:hypothetical protein
MEKFYNGYPFNTKTKKHSSVNLNFGLRTPDGGSDFGFFYL